MTQREEEVGLGVGSAAQRYAAYKAEAQAASSPARPLGVHAEFHP